MEICDNSLTCLQKLSSMKGFPNLTLQVTIKKRNFWDDNIYAAFCGPSCVKLRAAVTNFGPRATLCLILQLNYENPTTILIEANCILG